jgi:hypothetical protein
MSRKEVKRSVIAKDNRRMNSTDAGNFEESKTILHGTTMMDTRCYTFDETYRKI